MEGVSEYEKQRLSRIRENRARLEALGLPKLASSILGNQNPYFEGKGKATKNARRDADDDYQPSDADSHGEEDEDDDDNGDSSYSSEEQYSNSRQKGKKKKNKSAKIGISSRVRGKTRKIDVVDNDAALQQAIALSLGGATTDSGTVIGSSSQKSKANVEGSNVKKDRSNIKGSNGNMKSKKGNRSRVQLSEDEVVAYFFSFDVAGKGHFSLRDLQRMVTTHNFNWTDVEMANMIHFFDTDGDGKLCLDDFRTIVTRCNMMQDPKEC